MEPLVLLAIIGLFLVLMILAISGGLAIATYNADREARYALSGVTYPKKSAEAPKAPPAPPAPSELTRKITQAGVAETGPSLGVNNAKLGLWIFIASEMMFFSALISAFVVYRAMGRLDDGGHLSLLIASIGTFILIVSSFSAVQALEAVRENKQSAFIWWLLSTIVLGSVFLSIQGYEWAILFEEGITPGTDLFGTAFFVLTGFHGAHVAGGIIWLLFVLLKAFRGDFSPEKFIGIETFGLYWHFVDVVWILLFTIIYLI